MSSFFSQEKDSEKNSSISSHSVIISRASFQCNFAIQRQAGGKLCAL